MPAQRNRFHPHPPADAICRAVAGVSVVGLVETKVSRKVGGRGGIPTIPPERPATRVRPPA